MSFLPEQALDEAFGPFGFLRERFGFVPNLFRAQTLLPRVMEAEVRIASAVLREGALSQRQKEMMLLTIAGANDNPYCVTAHREMLRSLGVPGRALERLATNHRRAGLPPFETTLLDFGLKLTQRSSSVDGEDIEALRRRGFTDEQIVEALQVAALGAFLCTLAVGLGVSPDFDPAPVGWRSDDRDRRRAGRRATIAPRAPAQSAGVGYLDAPQLGPDTCAPFAFFREKFGFIPNIFRAQTLRPEVLEAEAQAVETVLLSDDVLSRVQKEYILLSVSAANLNTYCVAVHCQLLRGLGVSGDVSDQIAVDHRAAGLSPGDVVLLDFALKLSQRPREFSREDVDALRRSGFSEAQILESVVMTALTNFLNTVQVGLGVVPDFEPKRVFRPMDQPTPAGVAPPGGAERRDPDTDLVDRVRAGDLEAFEEIVRRYERRIYRTLVGLTGSPEDARDASQNAFLRAFKGLGRFRGASKFSTWLTRIAINEGLRRRKGVKLAAERGLDDPGELRLRQAEAWVDDPEELYSRKEIQELVERALARLPALYRVVVILRDIEQVPAPEAAAALGLSMAAFRSRLLRGRLLLREALTPHFVREDRSSARV